MRVFFAALVVITCAWSLSPPGTNGARMYPSYRYNFGWNGSNYFAQAASPGRESAGVSFNVVLLFEPDFPETFLADLQEYPDTELIGDAWNVIPVGEGSNWFYCLPPMDGFTTELYPLAVWDWDWFWHDSEVQGADIRDCLIPATRTNVIDFGACLMFGYTRWLQTTNPDVRIVAGHYKFPEVGDLAGYPGAGPTYGDWRNAALGCSNTCWSGRNPSNYSGAIIQGEQWWQWAGTNDVFEHAKLNPPNADARNWARYQLFTNQGNKTPQFIIQRSIADETYNPAF